MKVPPRAVPFWSPEEVEASIRDTITHLNERRVLAYPTETVYGFGGGVDFESVRNLVALKSRPRGKPFLILVAGVDMLSRLDLRLTHAASSLASRFWPSSISLRSEKVQEKLPPSSFAGPIETRAPGTLFFSSHSPSACQRPWNEAGSSSARAGSAVAARKPATAATYKVRPPKGQQIASIASAGKPMALRSEPDGTVSVRLAAGENKVTFR